ncbi:hypothetical protein SAMN04244559_01111 [Magnetospirillum fulvum]|uniref:Uncharacterized protein n=1 Tax=Magnetospirillum fulvum TaxID=1082 RepID=A0A1H6H7A4_MAGFU|nr:hypothetical protein SAMN04244559_01111 [Magnetospirillum fulvum]
MAKVVSGLAQGTKLVAKGTRLVALFLIKLSSLLVRMTGRFGLAFAHSSNETKTTTLTALLCAVGGIVLSPFVEITVMGSSVSSVLILALLGLVIGALIGYSAVKKVRDGVKSGS